ncbi:hypothetical protein D3C73_1456790 [compost metagenome]
MGYEALDDILRPTASAFAHQSIFLDSLFAALGKRFALPPNQHRSLAKYNVDAHRGERDRKGRKSFRLSMSPI